MTKFKEGDRVKVTGPRWNLYGTMEKNWIGLKGIVVEVIRPLDGKPWVGKDEIKQYALIRVQVDDMPVDELTDTWNWAESNLEKCSMPQFSNAMEALKWLEEED